jgi:hypothetical protein
MRGAVSRKPKMGAASWPLMVEAAMGGGREDLTGEREEGGGEGWRRRMRRSAAAHLRVGDRCRGWGRDCVGRERVWWQWRGEAAAAAADDGIGRREEEERRGRGRREGGCGWQQVRGEEGRKG